MKTTSSNNNLRVSHYQHYNPGSSNCEVGPDCQLRPDVDQSGAEDPQRQKDGGGLDAEGTRPMEKMELSWTSRVIVSVLHYMIYNHLTKIRWAPCTLKKHLLSTILT